MPGNAQSVSARRAKAIALIQAGKVHSQSDLVIQLKKAGYKVTQATASRDLEEIGAIRARNKDGESTYQIRESLDDAIVRSTPLPSKLILSVDHSANLAVIHTPPGAAQFLASSLRALRIASASLGAINPLLFKIARCAIDERRS